MATRTAGRVTLARETPPRTVDEAELREVVSELAAIYRPSASEGERQAAELIAARLERLGCKVTIDEESGTGGYWWSVGTMSAVGTVVGIVVLGSPRRRG